MSSIPIYLPLPSRPFEARILKAIPLLSPSLNKAGLDYDDQARGDRINALFFAAISFFIASVIFPAVNVHLVLAGLSIVALLPIDIWLTNWAWSRNTAIAFKQQVAPLRFLAERVISIPQVARWAVSFKADLNKRDVHGHNLLCRDKWISEEVNFEAFKIVVKNGFHVLTGGCEEAGEGTIAAWLNCKNESAFLWSAQQENSQFLEHLLKKSIVKSRDLSSEQLTELWAKSIPQKNLQLLKKFGFKRTSVA
ncbi:MAG: hypothetical protein KR126chlam1_01126 [Chlamydiae bacterium]|nr:hypothetical protein [Chlamydiota bacterium]